MTYHGPGQIVAYPVVDLSAKPDVRKYVAALEEAMIRTCADWGVAAGRHPEHRGAWVGPRKIGAVGVHLSRWITTHGLAFNADADLAHFGAIVPCGIGDPRLGVTTPGGRARRAAAAPRRRSPRSRSGWPAHLVRGRWSGSAGTAASTSAPSRSGDARRRAGAAPAPVRGAGRLLAAGDRPHRARGRPRPRRRAASCARRPGPTCRSARSATCTASPSARARPPRAGGGLRTGQETAFAARLPAGFAPRLSDEHREWGWFTPEEARRAAPLGRAAPGGPARRGRGRPARRACPRPRFVIPFRPPPGPGQDTKMITVEKIGGTSMSKFDDVLANIMLRDPKHVYGRVYIVSAYAGVTNELLEHKKTGVPGIYAKFASGDDYHGALEALLGKLKEINAGFAATRARRGGGRRLPRPAHEGAARLPGLDAPRAGQRLPAPRQRAPRGPGDAGRHRRGPQRVQQRGHPEGARA